MLPQIILTVEPFFAFCGVGTGFLCIKINFKLPRNGRIINKHVLDRGYQPVDRQVVLRGARSRL